MKKYLIVLLLIVVFATSSVSASEMRKGFGVGAAIGAPFTFLVSGEYNFGVASVGASLGFVQLYPGLGFFNVGVEGAYNFPFTLSDENNNFILYPSAGGRLDIQFGAFPVVSIGGVIGLNYLLETVPVKLFAKAIPTFQISSLSPFYLAMKGEVGAYWCF
ncbi:MAG: hypothetical protein EOM67_09085 [Spirochaetia bacterium]|nr:hypothetical protein [Spirochaetia bacterium]